MVAGLAAGCVGRSPVVGPPPPATEAEWRALAAPRPEPLPGAARLSLTGVELLADPPWSFAAPTPKDLALSELVVAGLLRRADVRFVERRRFAAAAEAERSGARRLAGAPPAGVSTGAELLASVVWVPLAAGQASLEVRLTDAARGGVVATRRVLLPRDADPVGVARQVVAALLASLGELGRLPAWSDPITGAAPSTFVPSGVSQRALEDFTVGLAAEESWRWEGAREAYQAAASSVGFFEASTALARTARLRLGGTLGEN
jgi:hypothetical protein